MQRRRFLVAGVAALVLSGCKPDTIRLSHQPVAGSRSTYVIEVRTTTTTRLGDSPEQRRHDVLRLRADQSVLSADDTGSRVRVELRDGSRRTVLVARFDRAAQLTAVEQVEGLPSDVLGALSLSDIFPAGAGAPPNRGLRPADRWPVDVRLDVPGMEAANLRGTGRLLELGVVHGRSVATVETRLRLPVQRTLTERSGKVHLLGVQHTTTRASRALSDGSVERARSRTTGRFRLTLVPTAGGMEGPPVPGALTLDVRSDVRRTN